MRGRHVGILESCRAHVCAGPCNGLWSQGTHAADSRARAVARWDVYIHILHDVPQPCVGGSSAVCVGVGGTVWQGGGEWCLRWCPSNATLSPKGPPHTQGTPASLFAGSGQQHDHGHAHVNWSLISSNICVLILMHAYMLFSCGRDLLSGNDVGLLDRHSH
jgi:hypothetical protein